MERRHAEDARVCAPDTSQKVCRNSKDSSHQDLGRSLLWPQAEPEAVRSRRAAIELQRLLVRPQLSAGRPSKPRHCQAFDALATEKNRAKTSNMAPGVGQMQPVQDRNESPLDRRRCHFRFYWVCLPSAASASGDLKHWSEWTGKLKLLEAATDCPLHSSTFG